MSQHPHTPLEDISTAMRRVSGDSTANLTPHEQEGALLSAAWEQVVKDHQATTFGTAEYKDCLVRAMDIMRARAKHAEGGQGHFQFKPSAIA